MIESGYLIVKTFEMIYEEYAGKYNLTQEKYGILRIDKIPDDHSIKYRGIYRDALIPCKESNIKAEVELFKLKPEFYSEEDVLIEDFLSDYEDALKIYGHLGDLKSKYEIIWVKIADCKTQAPNGYISIGFEPSYFFSDHFSASCDCMIIPRWHGTDKEGILFGKYFKMLNQYGLFNESKVADEFLKYYLSLDWTERGDYWVTEVFIKN